MFEVAPLSNDERLTNRDISGGMKEVCDVHQHVESQLVSPSGVLSLGLPSKYKSLPEHLAGEGLPFVVVLQFFPEKRS